MNLDEKINLFKKDGVNSIQIISDFDDTLTHTWNKDKTFASHTYTVLKNNGYFSKEYVMEEGKLRDHYLPIENDPNLSKQEKEKLMLEWWEKAFDLLIKNKLSKEILNDIADKKLLYLREKIEEFFSICNENKIPLLIFSAGIGDIIKTYFERNNLFNNEVHIISNLFNFDENGFVKNMKGKFVMSTNKGEVIIKGTSFYDQIKSRKNLILLGDKIEDLDMSEGVEFNNIITIGFFNLRPQDKHYTQVKKLFIKKFDLVLETTRSLEKVNEILEKILN